MITNDQLYEIAEYVRTFLFDSVKESEQAWVQSFPRAAEHRWQHTLNVLANAEQILEGEGADVNQAMIVRAAALLHDVSMFTCDHSIHGQVSADLAREYLEEQDYDPTFIEDVCLAVAEHGTDFGDLPPKEQGEQFSWAGRVLIEADILDKLGASAVAGALMYLGEGSKLNFEAYGELIDGPAYHRATFFKDFLWTATGRRMGERRYGFFLEFLERLQEEVIEENMPTWDE